MNQRESISRESHFKSVDMAGIGFCVISHTRKRETRVHFKIRAADGHGRQKRVDNKIDTQESVRRNQP